jgi:hypothetical protein
LAGSVRDAQGAPAEGALVVVFPTNAALWTNYGLLPSRIRTSAASNTGRYKITSLPAGDIASWPPQDQRVKWSDPEFFRGCRRGGARVMLSGDTANLDTNVAVILESPMTSTRRSVAIALAAWLVAAASGTAQQRDVRPTGRQCATLAGQVVQTRPRLDLRKAIVTMAGDVTRTAITDEEWTVCV